VGIRSRTIFPPRSRLDAISRSQRLATATNLFSTIGQASMKKMEKDILEDIDSKPREKKGKKVNVAQGVTVKHIG
jgi:hypothetical protein